MKKSNLIYIFINLFLILSIALFNYLVDPYFILHKNKPLHINRYLLDEPYIPIKIKKNKKYKYVLSGGSTVNVLNMQNLNKDLADISCFKIKVNDMAQLLFNYLDKHPETKTVFLPLDLRQIADTSNNKIKHDKSENLTSKEYFRLLFSIQTIKYSINKLIKRTPDYSVKLVKYKVHDIDIKPQKMEKIVEKSYSKMFKELKKRNIEVICFIPPVHATRLVYLNETIGYDSISRIKKFIIEQNGYLIDMATINKFTSKPIKDVFYLFTDLIHPTDIYGYYIYNILLDNPKKDEDLYTFLTKENVEIESQKEKEKILKWKKENKKEYKYYLEGDKKEYTEKIEKTSHDIPKDFKILNYRKNLFYKN